MTALPGALPPLRRLRSSSAARGRKSRDPAGLSGVDFLDQGLMILRAVRIGLRAVDREMMPETAPRRNDDFYALPLT
jgi:hypothetical protein